MHNAFPRGITLDILSLLAHNVPNQSTVSGLAICGDNEKEVGEKRCI